MSAFQETTVNRYYSSWTPFYVSPWDVARDLVTAALRILQDGDVAGILDTATSQRRAPPPVPGDPAPSPGKAGVLKAFISRIVIGLPLVGASSLVWMMLSVPFLGPVHWLARYRGNRRRNNNSRDITAFIIVLLLALGAAR